LSVVTIGMRVGYADGVVANDVGGVGICNVVFGMMGVDAVVVVVGGVDVGVGDGVGCYDGDVGMRVVAGVVLRVGMWVMLV